MTLTKAKKPTRRAFSDELVRYGEIDRDFLVMEADIGYSTYTYLFGDKYPDRYFNVGIAELGMMATAAGMAANGRTVLVSSYGVFLSMRALEAVRSMICYPNLNVKILSSHGGITAAVDGVSHQATEDMANLTTIPNMKVLCPADPAAAAQCVHTAFETPGPVFTRLMRDPLYDLYPQTESFPIGGSKVLREGTDVTIAAYGDMVFQAIEAAEVLASDGIEAEVLDLYSLKPLDEAAVLASAKKTGAVVVVENHQARNGLGYETAHLLLTNHPVPFENLGLQDTFAESGAYDKLLQKYGLSARHVAEAAERVVRKK